LPFQNVATYGGLCALATFDRAQLQKQVIGSHTFKLFLELDPQLREVLALPSEAGANILRLLTPAF
jgi:COP9 signalosome complex subunit 1